MMKKLKVNIQFKIGYRLMKYIYSFAQKQREKVGNKNSFRR